MRRSETGAPSNARRCAHASERDGSPQDITQPYELYWIEYPTLDETDFVPQRPSFQQKRGDCGPIRRKRPLRTSFSGAGRCPPPTIAGPLLVPSKRQRICRSASERRWSLLEQYQGHEGDNKDNKHEDENKEHGVRATYRSIPRKKPGSRLNWSFVDQCRLGELRTSEKRRCWMRHRWRCPF